MVSYLSSGVLEKQAESILMLKSLLYQNAFINLDDKIFKYFHLNIYELFYAHVELSFVLERVQMKEPKKRYNNESTR